MILAVRLVFIIVDIYIFINLEYYDLFKKAKALAENGKGRRLLNSLNNRKTNLSSSEIDDILNIYREIGLPKEVKILKERRGILRDDQYDALAQNVKDNCSSLNFSDFKISLRNLLSCGIKMNPTKM